MGVNGTGKSRLLKQLDCLFSLQDHDSSFCQQENLIWKDISVRNLLLFYIRVKSGSSENLDEIAEEFLLSDYLDKFAEHLPEGKKRMLNIALSMIGDSRVFILDEPTTWMDPISQQRVWKIINKKVLDGALFIIATQSMEEAETISTHLAIL